MQQIIFPALLLLLIVTSCTLADKADLILPNGEIYIMEEALKACTIDNAYAAIRGSQMPQNWQISRSVIST